MATHASLDKYILQSAQAAEVLQVLAYGSKSITFLAMIRRNQRSSCHFSDVVTNEALIGHVLADSSDDVFE